MPRLILLFIGPFFFLESCNQNDQPIITGATPVERLTDTTITTPAQVPESTDTTNMAAETELDRLLSELNSWPADELDNYERPWEYPGIVASGETGGWIDTHKELIEKQGGRVKWNAEKMQYELK